MKSFRFGVSSISFLKAEFKSTAASGYFEFEDSPSGSEVCGVDSVSELINIVTQTHP